LINHFVGKKYYKLAVGHHEEKDPDYILDSNRNSF